MVVVRALRTCLTTHFLFAFHTDALSLEMKLPFLALLFKRSTKLYVVLENSFPMVDDNLSDSHAVFPAVAIVM